VLCGERKCGFLSFCALSELTGPLQKFLARIIAETTSSATSSTTNQSGIDIAQSSNLKMAPFLCHLLSTLNSDDHCTTEPDKMVLHM